jgi:hypothetical protein
MQSLTTHPVYPAACGLTFSPACIAVVYDATRLQIFLLFGIVLAFFLLTTSLSPYVHLGLYDKYLKQHGGVFTLCLLSVLLVGSIGAYRLVRVCAAHCASSFLHQHGLGCMRCSDGIRTRTHQTVIAVAATACCRAL